MSKNDTATKKKPAKKAGAANANRFPIFPMRLRPDDRTVIGVMQALYFLSSVAITVRLCVRVLAVQKLSVEDVRVLNMQYEQENPGCLHIPVGKDAA